MSKITTLAEGLASFLSAYNAEVAYNPQFSIEDTKTMRVIVIPVGKERKIVSRKAFDSTHTFDVAVIHKVRSEGDIPELVDLVESIGNAILTSTLSGCVCMSSRWEPLYSIEDMRNKRLFISMIQVSFREIG